MQHDEAMHHLRVDVLDFYWKLGPSKHSRIGSRQDFFAWCAITADCHVRFVRMKLKGQARVWWQSIEEELDRFHQPPITH